MGEIKSYYKRFPHTVSFLLITVIMLVLFIAGCDNPFSLNHSDKDRLEELADSVNPDIPDDYSHISLINNFGRLGDHNVHDPTLIKEEGRIAGDWEYISLDKTFEMNLSQTLTFTSEGNIDGSEEGSWSFDGSNLTIDMGDQEPFDAPVFWGWDWENEDITLLFTGLNEDGIGQWGKQVVDESQSFIQILPVRQALYNK